MGVGVEGQVADFTAVRGHVNHGHTAAIEIGAADLVIDRAIHPVEPAAQRVNGQRLLLNDARDQRLHVAAVAVGAHQAGQHARFRLHPVDAPADFVYRQPIGRARDVVGVGVGDDDFVARTVEVGAGDALQIVEQVQLAACGVAGNRHAAHAAIAHENGFDGAGDDGDARQVADVAVVEVGGPGRGHRRTQRDLEVIGDSPLCQPRIGDGEVNPAVAGDGELPLPAGGHIAQPAYGDVRAGGVGGVVDGELLPGAGEDAVAVYVAAAAQRSANAAAVAQRRGGAGAVVGFVGVAANAAFVRYQQLVVVGGGREGGLGDGDSPTAVCIQRYAIPISRGSPNRAAGVVEGEGVIGGAHGQVNGQPLPGRGVEAVHVHVVHVAEGGDEGDVQRQVGGAGDGAVAAGRGGVVGIGVVAGRVAGDGRRGHVAEGEGQLVWLAVVHRPAAHDENVERHRRAAAVAYHALFIG